MRLAQAAISDGVSPQTFNLGASSRMESVMWRNFPLKNAPRVELDHRAREARLRLERVERLLLPRPAVRYPWLRRLIRLANTNAQQGQTGGSVMSWCISFSPAS